jgi:hypothetical protein
MNRLINAEPTYATCGQCDCTSLICKLFWRFRADWLKSTNKTAKSTQWLTEIVILVWNARKRKLKTQCWNGYLSLNQNNKVLIGFETRFLSNLLQRSLREVYQQATACQGFILLISVSVFSFVSDCPLLRPPQSPSCNPSLFMRMKVPCGTWTTELKTNKKWKY